jgi:hypothetical protein
MFDIESLYFETRSRRKASGRGRHMFGMEIEAERRREVLAEAMRHERPRPAEIEEPKGAWRAGADVSTASVQSRPSDEPVAATSGLRGYSRVRLTARR